MLHQRYVEQQRRMEMSVDALRSHARERALRGFARAGAAGRARRRDGPDARWARATPVVHRARFPQEAFRATAPSGGCRGSCERRNAVRRRRTRHDNPPGWSSWPPSSSKPCWPNSICGCSPLPAWPKPLRTPATEHLLSQSQPHEQQQHNTSRPHGPLWAPLRSVWPPSAGWAPASWAPATSPWP